MKKAISLMAIIFVFALFCTLFTGCDFSADVGGTTGNSASTGTADAGTTTQATTTTVTTATTSATQKTTSATAATTKPTAATTATTKATTQSTTKTTVTTKATTATTVTPKNITIFLDPGHGGSDPGVVRKYDGVTYEEADINLSVALFAKAALEKRGYTVIMSRETDESVSLNDRPALAQKAGADMFISIHVNSFSNENYPVPNSVSGPRIYYTHRKELSYDAREFATYFAEEFDDIRDVPLSTDPDKLAYPNMKIARVASDKDLYGEGKYLAVLSATKIPSVLIEMGFITNDNDLVMLKSQWWQRNVANAIADAVDRANGE